MERQENGHTTLCRELAEVLADLWEADPHQWSTRPCPTCRAVSGILHRDFGCIAYAKQRKVR